MNERIQERPDVLDAAGDAAATIDKHLAKVSAAHFGHTLLELSASEPQMREWTPTTVGLRGPAVLRHDATCVRDVGVEFH